MLVISSMRAKEISWPMPSVLFFRWVMYNQHQAALLELQQNNLHTQIDLKALSQPTDQVCSIRPCISPRHVFVVNFCACWSWFR